MAKHATREAWLVAAVKALRPLFKAVDKAPPDGVQVSVGYGRGKGSKVHGVCYSKSATEGELSTIFISPEIASGDPVYLLGVLLHELIHAADNCESKHHGWFAKTAKAVGLTGKMTSTVVGADLRAKLEASATKLGPYPHAVLSPGLSSVNKPDRNRQLKIECDCGYKLRGSRQVLDMGIPDCPVCQIPMEER